MTREEMESWTAIGVTRDEMGSWTTMKVVGCDKRRDGMLDNGLRW